LDKVGSTAIASSVFNLASGSDQSVDLEFDFDVPWLNERFIIYREEPSGSGQFDSIGESFTPNYRDTGRVNGENYCYYAEAYGRYTASDSLPRPLINRSQVACATARDTTAPCIPQFTISNVCPDTIYFSWKLGLGDDCSNDVKQINIYFRTGENAFGEVPLLSIPATGDSTIKYVSDETIFGCYAISAVDDADQDPGGQANESALSDELCIESCFSIGFPNVFTPNADGINDLFLPWQIEQVSRLEIEIYSRWGNLVYRNNNLEDFLSNGWDGTIQENGQDAAEGVYYYVCRYQAESIGPSVEQTASGFVHLLR
jgi:gliding motility-associated-like protein